MKKHDKIILALVETIEQAIEIGDWKVDGRCDPDMILAFAKEHLKKSGFKRKSSEELLLEPI